MHNHTCQELRYTVIYSIKDKVSVFRRRICMYRFNPRLVQSFIYSRHSIYSNYNVICRDAFDLGRSRQYNYLSLKSKGEVQYRSGLRSKVCILTKRLKKVAAARPEAVSVTRKVIINILKDITTYTR